MANLSPTVTHTLTAQGRTIALMPDEITPIVRGLIDAPMALKLERCGIRIATRGTTKVALTIRVAGKIHHTDLYMRARKAR